MYLILEIISYHIRIDIEGKKIFTCLDTLGRGREALPDSEILR